MFETLQEDQKSRWEKGDRVPVAFYLKQYPELKRDSHVIELLVQEEMRLRENAGEAIDKAAYLREYPECRTVIEAYQSTFETIGPSIAELAAPTPIPPAVVAPNQPTIAFETQLADFETALPADNFDTVPGPSTTAPRTVSSTSPRSGTANTSASSPLPVVPGFEIQSELGRGGMGIVYRAKQISANRTVALKLVRNDQLDLLPARARADALNRFITEAHAAASLQHDNIVAVYEVGEVPSNPPGGTPLHYYAMRFVQGDSLFDLVREGPLENRRTANYIQKIARALQAAHDQGILHRDIKPHNVMIEKGSDRPLLTDFGLAKIVDSGNSMTYSGQVMGTPSYMSPEQAVDAGQVTPAADQYSLGATLYHLLTGRPPFVASSVPETIRQILDKQPVGLRELNSFVHRDLETICLKSIQKDPLRRYSSCQELADDLQRYLDGVPIVARPVSRAERAVRWCRRNPGMATMIGSVAMLALSTLLAIVLGYRNTSAALAVSESRLEKALQVVDELFVRVSEDELLNEPGMQPLRRELLEKALKHYQYFLSESQDRGKVADEVAAASGGRGRTGFPGVRKDC
jgi:serine/threonine protein kinase